MISAGAPSDSFGTDHAGHDGKQFGGSQCGGSDTARDAQDRRIFGRHRHHIALLPLARTKEQTDEKILFRMRNAPLSTNHLFLTSVMDGRMDGWMGGWRHP